MPMNPMNLFRSFMRSPGARKATVLGGAVGAGATVPDAIGGAVERHDAGVFQDGASTGYEQGIESGFQHGMQQGAEMGARQAAEQMLAALEQGMGEAQQMQQGMGEAQQTQQGYGDPYGGMYREASATPASAPGFSAGAKVAKTPKAKIPLKAGSIKVGAVLAEIPAAMARVFDLGEKTASIVVTPDIEPLLKIAAGMDGRFEDPRLRSAAAAMLRKEAGRAPATGLIQPGGSTGARARSGKAPVPAAKVGVTSGGSVLVSGKPGVSLAPKPKPLKKPKLLSQQPGYMENTSPPLKKPKLLSQQPGYMENTSPPLKKPKLVKAGAYHIPAVVRELLSRAE